MTDRILAVDPGEKRIGIAVSDPSATIANPVKVLLHKNRHEDALQIIKISEEAQVCLIIIGMALDEEGQMKPIGRHAMKLADEIRLLTQIPVEMWDESGSTVKARRARVEMGVKRSKRSGHLDELAAVVILQSYLDHNENR
jgi:putative holliday junction resolvase